MWGWFWKWTARIHEAAFPARTKGASFTRYALTRSGCAETLPDVKGFATDPSLLGGDYHGVVDGGAGTGQGRTESSPHPRGASLWSRRDPRSASLSLVPRMCRSRFSRCLSKTRCLLRHDRFRPECLRSEVPRRNAGGVSEIETPAAGKVSGPFLLHRSEDRRERGLEVGSGARPEAGGNLIGSALPPMRPARNHFPPLARRVLRWSTSVPRRSTTSSISKRRCRSAGSVTKLWATTSAMAQGSFTQWRWLRS